MHFDLVTGQFQYSIKICKIHCTLYLTFCFLSHIYPTFLLFSINFHLLHLFENICSFY